MNASAKLMHRISIVTLIATLCWLPLAGQTSPDQQRFAGVWEAKFKGAVICTIKLKAGETISGETSGCSIQVNEEGDLVETERADQPGEPSPILNAKLHEDTLSFETKDDDESIKFELKLTGEERAELRFVDAPVKIKPIRFERR